MSKSKNVPPTRNWTTELIRRSNQRTEALEALYQGATPMANYTSGITYNTTNATTSGSFNVDWNTWTPGPITTGGSIPFTGTEFTTYTTPVQVPQCAHCLVRGAELRYAVTIVDGTAVCKEHAGLLLAIIEEEPDD